MFRNFKLWCLLSSILFCFVRATKIEDLQNVTSLKLRTSISDWSLMLIQSELKIHSDSENTGDLYFLVSENYLLPTKGNTISVKDISFAEDVFTFEKYIDDDRKYFTVVNFKHNKVTKEVTFQLKQKQEGATSQPLLTETEMSKIISRGLVVSQQVHEWRLEMPANILRFVQSEDGKLSGFTIERSKFFGNGRAAEYRCVYGNITDLKITTYRRKDKTEQRKKLVFDEYEDTIFCYLTPRSSFGTIFGGSKAEIHFNSTKGQPFELIGHSLFTDAVGKFQTRRVFIGGDNVLLECVQIRLTHSDVQNPWEFYYETSVGGKRLGYDRQPRETYHQREWILLTLKAQE